MNPIELGKLIAIISLLFLPRIASAQDPVVKSYGVEDGLANSTVYYVMQDSKGFLWFCTETGVNRFDGHHFETFTIEDGLADNENFKSFEDAKGRIWFCSYNGRLSYYQDGFFYNETNKPSLKYDSKGLFIFDIHDDKQGNMWFSNLERAIYKFDGTRVKPLENMPRLQLYNGPHFFMAGNTLKILSSIEKGPQSQTIHIAKDGRISHKGLKSDPRLKTLAGFHYSSERCATQFVEEYGLLYIQNGNNIFYAKNDSLYEFLNTSEAGIEDLVLSFYYAGNTLWLGTRSNGIYKIENPLSPKRKVTNIFADYSVTAIGMDKEGGLWFCTWGNGVFLLSPNNMNARTIGLALPPNSYPFQSITVRHNPFSIAAGSSNGMILIFDSSMNSRSIDMHSRAMNRVSTLHYFQDKSLFASSDILTGIIDKSSVRVIEPQENCRAIKSASYSDSRMLAATSNRIWELRKGKVSFLLKDAKFISVASVDDSAFYYSTTKGLYKYEHAKKSRILILAEGTLKSLVNDIIISGNEVWAGTHGNGIFVLKNDRITHHLTKKSNGLASDICQKLFYDGRKYIWQCTNKGISILDQSNKVIHHTLSTNDGLLSNDVKAVCSDGNYAYIAAGTGISILSLNSITFNAAPPKTLFTAVKYGGNIINTPSSVTFTYFKGAVDITYTGITFNVPEEVEYQYRFGEEEKWITTRERFITLYDMSPGRHTVELRAKKYNSGWSKPVLLAIDVKPLFWQTWLFKSGLILLAAGVIVIIARSRINAVRNREKEKTLVNKQIAELENKALAFQMNPHFVFNSLNTVQQFILSKEEEPALNYLSDFAVLMRQILNNSKKAFIPMQDEVGFLHKYLELERIRFNDNFDYQISIDESVNPSYVSIPPMLLQPLVENAVKYSMTQTTEKKLIQVSIALKGDFIQCTVEDDGAGIYAIQNAQPQIMKKKDSTALQVVKARLGLIRTPKGETGTISIVDKSTLNPEWHGTIVTLFIPVIIESHA